jgi:hypothetical protein
MGGQHLEADWELVVGRVSANGPCQVTGDV